MRFSTAGDMLGGEPGPLEADALSPWPQPERSPGALTEASGPGAAL
jgi:hypothetical protein